MENPLLSIIIPVYKAESTLDRCIQSLLNQGYDPMEIILVDDGSPDRSPQICEEWAERKKNIRVVHQSNQGVGAARNRGIEIAQGDYITFVDSDDYLAPNTYHQNMKGAIAEPTVDLFEFPVQRWVGAKQIPLFAPRKIEIEKDPTRIISFWVLNNGYERGYVWNKIFKKHLFDNVRFQERDLFEDLFLLIDLFQFVKEYAIAPLGSYHYMDLPGSLSKRISSEDLELVLRGYMNICERTKKERRCAEEEMLPLYLWATNFYIQYRSARPCLANDSYFAPWINSIAPSWRSVTAAKLTLKNRAKAVLWSVLGTSCYTFLFAMLVMVRKPSRGKK